ncbi:MAG: class I SAM-dependent RNA methyltransferase [bacterium]
MPIPAPVLLDCFAAVAPGLEVLALAEARALGLDARAEEGGLAWSGDIRSVLRANVGLRIASRVLVRLDAFDAKSFAELERHARRIPWNRIVRAGDAVRFRVTCKKSRLYHSDAVAQRLADAIMRAVPGVRAEGSSVGEDEPVDHEQSALFVVRLVRDRCTVSADASGELLHRRGYRQATAKAPLRETLAAALLIASEWDGVAPLLDPLCGSGTIPIEGALLARRIPPGARRTFAAERWPGVSATVGAAVRSELAEGELGSAPGPIVASDRDAGAIEAARANAERAGVGSDVELAIHSVSALTIPAGPTGWIVTNPPYGVRVGDSDRVRDLWAQFGRVLREKAPGWRVAILSPDPALERQLQLPLRVVGSTSNGGIPIRIVVGRVAGGARTVGAVERDAE